MPGSAKKSGGRGTKQTAAAKTPRTKTKTKTKPRSKPTPAAAGGSAPPAAFGGVRGEEINTELVRAFENAERKFQRLAVRFKDAEAELEGLRRRHAQLVASNNMLLYLRYGIGVRDQGPAVSRPMH